MAVNFLHGVETIELRSGARPVRVVKTAVIGLVSFSPTGPKQALTICQSATDDAQFGVLHPDNWLRSSLDLIRAQSGGGLVLVVNAFDPAQHTASTTETLTVRGGRVRLAGLYADNLVVEQGATTLTEGTDYTYNADTQIITILTSATYPDGTVLTVSFDAADPSTYAAADAIGGTTSGVRTGLDLFDIAYSSLGMNPKILVVPFLSDNQSVANAMLTKANAYRAFALLDAANDATVTECIQGRGTTAGTVKNFYTSSFRGYLLYPRVVRENLYARDGSTYEMPYSVAMAGVMAWNDSENGYWASPSNKPILGILRAERTLTAQVNRADTEVNLLNENGICTIFNSFGTGYKTWGNHSAAWPTETLVNNFVAVQRVADTVHESLELAMLQFIDQPGTPGVINSIKETGNAFLRTLIQRGAVLEGEVTYDPGDNPPVDIAQGQYKFRITFISPIPMKRLSFLSLLDINLLASLGAA